jgi:hypothetical protein
MAANQTFDAWFEKLTSIEKQGIINHILKTKLTLTTEGLYAGPTGELLKKGLFSGPTAPLGSTKCPYCGK